MIILMLYNEFTSTEVVTELKRLSQDKKIVFDNMDFPSLSFSLWLTRLIYSSVGVYGPEARVLGLEILKSFVIWQKAKGIFGTRVNGYDPIVVEKLYEWACDFTNPYNLPTMEIIILVTRKKLEIEKAQANNAMWYNAGLVTGLGIFMAITYSYCPYFRL